MLRHCKPKSVLLVPIAFVSCICTCNMNDEFFIWFNGQPDQESANLAEVSCEQYWVLHEQLMHTVNVNHHSSPPSPPHSQRLRCGSPSSPPPTTIIPLSKAAVLAVFGWAGGDNLNLWFWGRVCFMCSWSTSSHRSVDHLLMQNRLLLTSTDVNPNFCRVSIFTGKLEHSLLFYWCLLFYWTYCTFLQCCYIIDKQVSDLVI